METISGLLLECRELETNKEEMREGNKGTKGMTERKKGVVNCDEIDE